MSVSVFNFTSGLWGYSEPKGREIEKMVEYLGRKRFVCVFVYRRKDQWEWDFLGQVCKWQLNVDLSESPVSKLQQRGLRPLTQGLNKDQSKLNIEIIKNPQLQMK